MSDRPNPDWVTWLARAEADAAGEDDRAPTCLECAAILPAFDAPCPYCEPAMPDRPDRGWQRLGDVAAKIVAGITGGGVGLLAAGCALYALRAL